MTEHATGQAAVVASMIFEGLFEQYRDLRVVLIESGFGWLPALGWRLDKHWERMRDEVPHVKRPPSEYIREHFWVSTQPMEEAEEPEHLIDTMSWVGFDHILFLLSLLLPAEPPTSPNPWCAPKRVRCWRTVRRR